MKTGLLDTFFSILGSEQRTSIERSVFFMKGYFVPDGYMGYVNGAYMLFADERDYQEYLAES